MADNRKDWEENHTKIQECLLVSIKTLGKIPSYNEIAKETGLHKNTIANHFDELSSTPMADRMKKCHGYLDSIVEMLMMKILIGADVAAANTLLKLINLFAFSMLTVLRS